MESLLYPSKIQLTHGADDATATLSVEPLTQGYGTTIGNALRRVLLSSLPGAAVTAVKIKNASHEFTAIPNVKEDVLEIILQLKQLRLKVFSDEPVKLTLKADGKRKVTAKDIEPNADVQIVNSKLSIATLTSPDATLEMEITVEKGRGYRPTEERKTKELELGTIAIDALYSPVQSVGFKVENVRVGEITNFDKLLLTVETDGTITPQQAIEESVKILMNHYEQLGHISAATSQSVDTQVAEPALAEPAATEEPAPSADEKPKKRGKKKAADEE